MNNGQLDISTIIIAGVAVIIGVILIAIGNRKNKRMLRIVGIGFCIGAGVTLFVESAELRDILTAFAAIVAVIIAAFSIEQSRQMRKDSIERESRDRKERLVNEVAEWLRELEGNIFAKYAEIISGADNVIRRMSSGPKITPKTLVAMEALDRALVEMGNLAGRIKEAEYYQKLTLQLDEDLSKLIGIIANEMEQGEQMQIEDAGCPGEVSREAEKSKLRTELLKNDDRPLEGLGLSDKDIISVRLGRNAGAIRKSIRNALDRVIELKTSLI